MKVLSLTLVAVLLIGASGAVKIRRGEKRTDLEEKKSSEIKVAAKAEVTKADTDKKEKEVYKRGIFHYGGALASHASLWPKRYAAHYGYGLHLPTASGYAVPALPTSHLQVPSALKYNSGFHYKSLAAPSVLPGISSTNAAVPTYTNLSPTIPHVTSQPFNIRPGGAVVQSYSVIYPNRKPVIALVKPGHSFAAVSPLQHLHPVQSVAAVQPVHPIAAVQPIQPVHAFQTVPHVHQVQPVQSVQTVAEVPPVQHVAAVQPVHHLQPVQPVQHLHPVQPLRSVVQVQHFKPPVHYGTTQQFPSFFQTSFVPAAPVPAISQPPPTISFNPSQTAFPAIPTFPNPPAFPTIPSVPTVPSHPSVPAIPAVSANPFIPTIPSISLTAGSHKWLFPR